MTETTAPGTRLFEPITINGLTLPHRLWVAPMCMYSSVDGMPNDWHLVHLGSFAVGRAGLVMTEATAVSPEGRITPDDAGIWTDEHAVAWRRIVDFAHGMKTAIGIQLAHAGRKASTHPPTRGKGSVADERAWTTVGPSPVAYGDFTTPAALEHDGIARVVADFAAAARRAVDAGFDLVEVHAAHGYLLGQFLSTTSNLRTDEYGGDVTDRARLTREVVAAVRAVIPAEMPLVLRISATEWVPDGVTVEDTIEALHGIDGVDLVSVSSGGNHPGQQIPNAPGYQLPLSREIRASITAPVGAAGLITTPEQAESAIAAGDTDVVYVARQFLRDPMLALHASAALGGELEWPWQYDRAKFYQGLS
jgi:2,4-dienoyl-CoA reductase-like NADH-dependent reductase (Old Yellow Enzyme family)